MLLCYQQLKHKQMSLKQQFSDLGFSSNREVAALLGISAGTVSLAFNGKSPNTQTKMRDYLAAADAQATDLPEADAVVQATDLPEADEVLIMTSEMVTHYVTTQLETKNISPKESFCLLRLLTGYSNLRLRQLLIFWGLSVNDTVIFKGQAVTALCTQAELRQLLHICGQLSTLIDSSSDFTYALNCILAQKIKMVYTRKDC
jgi:hypothetical protein